MSESFKLNVHKASVKLLNKRIEELRAVMEETQAAANSVVKSSVGDKHHTTRARLQADVEKVANQLANMVRFVPVLSKINPESKHDKVEAGTLVQTDSLWIYLSVPLGSAEVDGEQVQVISPAAPLGQKMLGKEEGDEVEFNGTKYQILKVW